MIFPQLFQFAEIALFLLRLMVGVIFLASGWRHVREPGKRSRDIGLSKAFTMFLGAAELAGGFGLIAGLLVQVAAMGLILIMIGAIQRKIVVWHTGFWGSAGTNGWSYDVMIIVMNLVIITTDNGSLSLPWRFA